MKASRVLCSAGVIALALVVTGNAGAEMNEATIKAKFDSQVNVFIRTTGQDLKPSLHLRNPGVDLLTAEMKKTNSLVTPYKGEVNYLIEYDNPNDPSERDSHAYLLKATYFDGRWDIDPHAHKNKKHVEDLEPKKSQMLFPNI